MVTREPSASMMVRISPTPVITMLRFSSGASAPNCSKSTRRVPRRGCIRRWPKSAGDLVWSTTYSWQSLFYFTADLPEPIKSQKA